MLCFVLCLLLVPLPKGVYGSLAEEVAETTQQCCNQGTAYARNHTMEECSSSVPPDVPSVFGTLCIFAMDQCCKEYFDKKSDCDSGIDISSSVKRCDSTKDSIKSCCKECTKGKAASGRGDSCVAKQRGNSAEELLAGDAYAQCCKDAKKHGDKASSKNSYPVTASKPPAGTEAASLCEEYAPNELCAHHCIPVPGSYKCECNPGHRLMADGRNCVEVTKNRCKPRNPCQHKCNDNGLEVKCSCRRGYQLMQDEKSCEDIDECLLDPPICLSGTQCHNIQGSYKCIPDSKPTGGKAEKGHCPAGFSKNMINHACDDINECQLSHPPCPSYLCENTIGGYKCGGVLGDPANLPNNRPVEDDRCPQGFSTGVNEECEDVDECYIHKDDCNPLSQFCINTRGSYYCQNKVSKHCPPGFKINPETNKCEDINECEDGQDICRPDQMCVNVLGEYDCKPRNDVRHSSSDLTCPEGKRLKLNGVCEDIDECAEGIHLCDQYQTCLNTDGSHECYCKYGFKQDPATGACIDVNECATDQHNCIPGSQRCDNTVGSFLCIRITSCGTGYVLQYATSQCEDIDECALGTHNCDRAGNDYQCENRPGSFRCIRKRRSTTSTTQSPEYEYEYYDSDEETTDNQTKPEQKQPTPKTEQSPTTTHPTTSSESSSVTLTKTTERIPQIDVEPPYPYDPRPSVNNYEPQKPNTKPSQPEQPPELPSETKQKPELTYDRYPQPESEKPVQPEEPKQPEQSKSKEPKYEPEEPSYEPQEPKIEQPQTYNEPEPEPKETQSTSPTPPQVVFVERGEETATVQGEKKEDGSVVVDTQNVPKNKWTKVNEKPSDCQFGFEMDVFGACVDIDECATNRHSCSGLTETCRNTMGGYLCECAPGFRRDLFRGVCDFIITSSSTTSTSTVTPTEKTSSFFWGYPDYTPITNRPFRPRSLCDVGYHFNTQDQKCEDINECTNGQANCAAVEICVNTDGGYRCECPPNWQLDTIRHKCVPIKASGQFPTGYGNEPVYPPVNPSPIDVQNGLQDHKIVEPEVTLHEDRGSVITCPVGYKLGYDNTCEDIDECATGKASCGAMLCTNLPGGYVCSCPAGHKLVDKNRCEDVDECALGGNIPICSQNADCVNTVGSYQCKCHKGFRSAPVNDKVCVDVDECSEAPSGSLCQHRCNNVWGGYRCSCHRGYRLNSDNRTCSDVDECIEHKSKVLCIGKCMNEPGSYRCACPAGYRLSEDKRSCIDIDECETGEAPCAGPGTYAGASDVCLNTRGGYRCHRINCPPGYKLESRHRCTRIEKICPASDWECAHQPTTYSYNFITFVSKLYIPASKVDLFTMRGPAWPNAKMRFQLRLADVNAPPTVKDRADIHAFLLVQNGNQAVVSLVRSLEGPQSIELELSMELYNAEQFGGIAVAKLYIHVSEYEF